jgi:benzoyl-CoA reductase/2-hydroxyglutaryl-CoA dehydratase subunit BcrC/BadD/HgdB
MSAADQSGSTSGEPLAILQHYYRDRLAAARELKRTGARVVGIIGHVAPLEMVLAASAVPITITSDPKHPTPTADQFMPAIYGWEAQSVLEQILQGRYEEFDLIVATQPYRPLYYVLKELYRQGKLPRLPELYLCDFIPTRLPSIRNYNARVLAHFAERMERLHAAPLSASAIREAIATTNAIREQLRRLQTLRLQRRISGVEAMQVIGAGYFLGAPRYRELLADYLVDAKTDQALTNRPRVLLVSSEPLNHLTVHQALESAGAIVVGEDDAWGCRSAEGDIASTAPPEDALLDKYFLHTASPQTSPRDARLAWFLERTRRQDLEAVVFYIPPSDRSLGWDYPSLKTHLAEVGLPSHLLSLDLTQPEARDAACASVARFLQSLAAAKRTPGVAP